MRMHKGAQVASHQTYRADRYARPHAHPDRDRSPYGRALLSRGLNARMGAEENAMLRHVPATLCCATSALILVLSGCVLDWDKKKKADSTSSVEGRDGGDAGGSATGSSGGAADASSGASGMTDGDSQVSELEDADVSRDGGTSAGNDAGTSGGATDAATGAADTDACSPNPCQAGATCTDGVNTYKCNCPAGTTGPNCEGKVCGDVVIRTRQDIVANRACGEIHDLSVEGYDFDKIGEFDFPLLTKVTGSLKMVIPLDENIVGGVGEVTFVALESIVGGLSISKFPASAFRFPKLRQIGQNWDFAYTGAGILDFPELASVGNGMTLAFSDTCKLNFPKLSRVGAQLSLLGVKRLPPSEVVPLREATAASGYMESIVELGCCYAGLAVECSTPLPDPNGPECGCGG